MMLNNSQKSQLIEGILFLKGKQGIKISELKSITKINDEEFEEYVNQINDKYVRTNSPFIIKLNGEKIRISLNKETSELISKKLNKPLKIKLTRSSIEVLTIISYYQPITKKQINQIRKANSDYIITKLFDLELIEAKERAHTVGNPRLWTTTNTFLEAFDLESIEDLPDYKERREIEKNLLRDLDEEESENKNEDSNNVEEKE